MEQPKEQRQPETAMLTVAETCAYLRISKWSVYQLIRKGQLPSVKIGRRRLIPMASIEKLVQQQLQTEAEGGG